MTIDREPRFYTVAELARRLSLSTRTIKDMIASGEIPSYKIRGARRISPADVDSMLARCRDEKSTA